MQTTGPQEVNNDPANKSGEVNNPEENKPAAAEQPLPDPPASHRPQTGIDKSCTEPPPEEEKDNWGVNGGWP